MIRSIPRETLIRSGLVAVVLIAILGGAWIVSEKAGIDVVGTGGVNARLIPKVGEEAPELLTIGVDGTPIPLSALRGHPVWLNFWGSWCQPCRAEMPEVIAAYETLNAQGVIMLGVNGGESQAQALNYAATAGITFPVVFPFEPSDEQKAEFIAEGMDPNLVNSTESWQINTWPTHIFIDANGIVQAVVLSGLTYDSAIEYGSMIIQ